jgi:hypothetical protein
MKQVRDCVLAVGLALAVLTAAPQGEPESAGEPKSKVGGIVVSAKTSEPLRGARVTLQPNGRGMRRGSRARTTTDLNGRFLLTEVAAGRYTIYAEKTAYETRRGTQIGNINLGQDESETDLVIELRPAAVITGRVFDSYGEPVSGATVAALRRNYVPGRPSLESRQTARTDDLGEYRLYGLAMGKYVVGVNPPEEPAPKGAFVYEQLPSYYPGTMSSDEASTVKVTWGMELEGIDIRLASAPATAVSGFVGDGATGEPLEAYLTLATEGGSRLGSFSTTGAGRFALYGLPPKKLLVQAFSRKGGSFAFARGAVHPSEARVEKVDLLIQPSVTVSGKVVLVDPPEGSEQDQVEGSGGRRGSPMLWLRNLGAMRAGRRRRVPIPLSGGPFELDAIQPGEYRVQAGAPEGSYLKTLARSGRRIEGLEVTVLSDSTITDLELHFAFDGASVSGTVVSEESDSDAGVEGARIVMIPDDPEQFAGSTSATVGDDDSFEMLDLPPGGYTLFAVSERSALDLWDPDVRKALRTSGKHLQLDPKEQAVVELSPIPEPDEPL